MTADNGLQKTSAAYRLPALDTDFLLGDSMRGVRLQLEYQKAEEILRAWTVRSTSVVFGSARVRAAGDLDKGALTDPPSPGRAGFWYEQARSFGRIASQRGGALLTEGGVRDNVIATGGGPNGSGSFLGIGIWAIAAAAVVASSASALRIFMNIPLLRGLRRLTKP